MASTQRPGLWNPGTGIQFDSKQGTKSLYPLLDFSRFFHNGAPPRTREDGYPTTPPPQKDGEAVSVDLSDDGSYATAPTGFESKDAPTEAGKEPAHQDNEDDLVEVVAPPWTALDFNVSNESFRAAQASAAGSAGSFWSHTLYQNLQADGSIEKVQVHYCLSRNTMEKVCQKYFAGEKVLGFDLEWSANANGRSGPRANVSLIQLASPGHIGLFHAALFEKDEFVAPTFRAIMGSSAVSKVGVSIRADCTRLRTHLGVDCRGIFELSHLYKLVKFTQERKPAMINKSLVSLATQVQECLGLPLFKGLSVRSSDWTRRLDSKQLAYSAGDAYAGVQLYHVLEAKRQKLDPVPPRPHHAELNLPIETTPISSDAEDHQPYRGTADMHRPVAPAWEPRKKISTLNPTADIRDSRVVAAELAMQLYRAQQGQSQSQDRTAAAAPSALRAYYLWHDNEDLQPATIAGLLRDPPLKTHTVHLYVLDAIMAEKLPYCKARLKSEIVSTLDPQFAFTKYRDIINECQD